MDARVICREVRSIKFTDYYIPLMGYIVLYDNNQFAFGKVTYVEELYPFTQLLTKFFSQFCINHNLSLGKRFRFPTRMMQVRVLERHDSEIETVRAIVVRNISKKRKLKRIASVLPGFNETLREYERLYKSLRELPKL